jgi:hypothetical protein
MASFTIMIVRAFENSIENKVGQINFKKILANQTNIVRYKHGTFRHTKKLELVVLQPSPAAAKTLKKD